MKKVLFLSMPHLSLRPSAGSTSNLLMSTTEVLGGLEHHGYDATCYDLNARLDKMKYELTDDDKNILENFDVLKEFLEKKDYNAPLYQLAFDLLFDIDITDGAYDVIAFSLSRWNPMLDFAYTILHFAAIVASLFSKKVIFGGVLIHNAVGQQHILDLIDTTDSNIEMFIYGDGREHFYKYIDNPTPDVPIKALYYPNIELFHKRPSINIKNLDDLNSNFDELCSMDIQEKYNIANNNFAIMPFRFTRGCIFNCAYCGTPKKLTTMDSVKAVDYLEYWYDQGQTDFLFYNDNINFKMTYIMSFCDEIIKRNMKIQFSDSANLIMGTEEMYSALTEAGCIKLVYGTETPSPNMLERVNKRNKYDKVCEILNMAHKNDIWIGSNIICNFPYEEEEDFAQTVEFLSDMKDIIDIVFPNIFFMTANSDYGLYPEKHDITINDRFEYEVNSSTPRITKTWYENNGLKNWDDITKRGVDRFDRLLEVCNNGYVDNIKGNDTILYNLRKQFDKETTRKIMSEMANDQKED